MKRQRNTPGGSEGHVEKAGVEKKGYLTLQQYLTNIIRTNEDKHESLGCVGHSSMNLWVDLLSESKIEWTRLFWEAFSFMQTNGGHNLNHDEREARDEQEMWNALKLLKQHYSETDGFSSLRPTMSQFEEEFDEQDVHRAFITWENSLADQHILFVHLQKESEKRSGQKKIDPQDAMSMIELILNNEYDLVHPTRASAIEALHKILEVAFFADKEDRSEK